MANVKIKYNGEKHTKLREALRNRIHQGQFAVSRKTTDYSDAEEQYMAYMPVTEADKLREDKKDGGVPQYVNIDIPFSYAVLMSWHTYVSTVFLSRTPVLQFAGRHGETEQQVQMVEAIMDYQTQIGGHMVPYYIWFMDAGKYGVGVVGHYWDEEITQVSEIVEEPVTYLGLPLSGKTRKVKRTSRVKGYEGNRVYNVRPQDFLFDSRVSMLNFQDGEFCGRYADLSWNTLVRRAEYGQYYNLDELKKVMRRKATAVASGTHYRDTGSEQMQLPDAVTGEDTTLTDDLMTPDFVNVVEMYVELIPKDWGLGKSTYPEMWVFTLAEDDIIIESQPYDSLHGKFPYSLLEFEIEGYGLQKRGLLELLDPLNDTMSWLVNTHFHNVRAVLNGQFVTDPSRVTMKDFRSEGGGRLIRLKPTAYGQDVRTMIHQLQTTDVTQTHLRDVEAVGQLIQRVSGVTDNIMGMTNQGGRKTATEVRSANVFGANRLKTQSEYFSAMGFAPLSQMLLQETQQRYSEEKQFKIAGDTAEEGAQFVQVTPEAITGFYDFMPVDGTMPVDRYAQVTMWTQLLGQLRSMPQIAESYDMGGIFAWVAQLAGLKNIKRFRINVRPDQDILRDAERGNVIGVGDARRETQGNGGSPENSTGVPGTTQNPGMGPTG